MDEPSGPSQSKSSDYFGEEDSQFLEALHTTVLPGDVSRSQEQEQEQGQEEEDLNLEPPPLSQFSLKRHRYLVDEDKAGSLTTERGIPAHENDDTYGASRFGEFGEYMRRKRAKLQIQNSAMEDPGQSSSQIFKGLSIYVSGQITQILHVFNLRFYRSMAGPGHLSKTSDNLLLNMAVFFKLISTEKD